MLNISKNNINKNIDFKKYQSLVWISKKTDSKLFIKILYFLFGFLLILLFFPWTQNIRSDGFVTTLNPDQRLQTLHSVIGGRIEKWYVKEGDFAKKGDTLMYISETKDQFFDPNLLINTQSQIKAKEQGVTAYMDKVKSLDNQIDALLETKRLKLTQAQNKFKQARLAIVSDSISFQAAIANYQITNKQYNRFKDLHKKGLKSLTDLEIKKLALQESLSLRIKAENKLLTTRNMLINSRVELLSIKSQYVDKIAKAESEKQAALSAMYEAESIVTKMQNQYMNFSIRKGYYFITSPQDGYITRSIRAGIGETVKEGEDLMSIMPSNYDLAIEVFVDPIDMPLVHKGEKVRIIFDGWPSVVFSGWPSISYGTFGGEVYAKDKFISKNGKFRILIAPDLSDHSWPEMINVGSGATGITLLNDVPIWYELWRNLSGFPPEYYLKELD
ncbi:HlyD family secretion protein [Flavobacteriales bacterium]|nr:HlyD family secretion protein [Flavobacteriales bacterium]|tara:strand:- start:1670 stop:3001 length:1332 start_codon:yes stop_codon:yes gene_type:complete